MKVLTVTFDKLIDGEHGKQAIFSSKNKGPWKPKDIAEGLDLSHLEPGKMYQVSFDDSAYWKVTKVSEATFSARKGGYNNQAYNPLQFVSNCVGSAIQAGIIKEPKDIQSWAEKAWIAVTTIEKPRAESKEESEVESKAESKSSSAPGDGGGPWTCPGCGAQAIRKSKFKNEWYCFPALDGCKAHYGINEPRITIQFDGGGEDELPIDNEKIPF